MVGTHKNHPSSTEGNKSPLILHQKSIFKRQFIDSLIDPDTLHYLHEQQGIDSIADSPTPIVVKPTDDENAKDEEMHHINNILSMEELAEK